MIPDGQYADPDGSVLQASAGGDVGERTSKADIVYTQLRTEIETGTLRPGDSLSENQLVSRLDASRTPLRDALRRLIDDGLAVREGGRGLLRVSPISLSGVRDLFDFRTVLETAAFSQLAQGIRAGSIAPDRVAGLEDELRGLRARRPSPQRTAAFYELAERFDQAVMDLTPNPMLGSAIRDLRPHTARLRSVAHKMATREEASMAEHAAMMSALLEGDAEAAVVACRQHLQRTVEAIFDGLTSQTPGIVSL